MKSLKPPNDGCFTACVDLACEGGEVGASKKLPPPANDEVGFGATAAALGLFMPLSRPANGDAFDGCCGADEKLKLAKASFIPPNAD
jgi:hypothetical protein